MNARHTSHLSSLKCAKNFLMSTRRNFGHGSRLGELRKTARTFADGPARFFLGMGRDSTATHAGREGVTEKTRRREDEGSSRFVCIPKVGHRAPTESQVRSPGGGRKVACHQKELSACLFDFSGG